MTSAPLGLLAIALAVAACSKGAVTGSGAGAPGPVRVATLEEASRALEQIVRVEGTLRRQKLGDAVHTPAGLAVVCLAPRFADEMVDTDVAVEGKLELTDEFQSTPGPGGEVSQGTAPGSSTHVIRVCSLRAPEME